MSEIKRSMPREIKIQTGTNPYAAGSVIIECGNTKVHITATAEESVPPWLKGKGEGWVTAEYNMLPGSTHTRIRRERNGPSGRSQEIQRLIGRSLRAAVDLKKLGEKSISVDCDVLIADGGTRTTSITGSYVALALALKKLGVENALKHQVAAISVGVNKDGNVIADLNYEEDSSCETDMNVVMTSTGNFVEIQGTAEGEPFTPEQFQQIVECSKACLAEIFKIQNQAIQEA